MIETCVFPVAGRGARLRPLTNNTPKALLDVGGQSLTEHAVIEAVAAGMAHFCFVTSVSKHPLFDARYASDSRGTFSYVVQPEPLGLGDAIGCAKNIVGDKPFAVLLPDDFCVGESVWQEMSALNAKYQCSIVAVEAVSEDRISQYGVIDGVEIQDGVYKVNSLVEKPSVEEAPSNLAVIGRYILTPDIFSLIEESRPLQSGEIQITDALQQQALRGNVIAYRIDATRYDCGSLAGLALAKACFS